MYVASTVGDHQKVARELRKHIEPLLKVSLLSRALLHLLLCGITSPFSLRPNFSLMFRSTRLTWLCGPTTTPTRGHATSFADSADPPTELPYTSS